MHKELRELWKKAFGDSDAFLDIFQSTAFSKDRCQYLTEDGHIVSALYWFDCTLEDKKIAYIYAVATDEKYRGKGLCHKLMEQTHKHLKELGYIGAILSPATDDLIRFYEKMGYEICTYVDEITFDEDTLVACDNNFSSKTEVLSLRKISKKEFSELRQDFLPENALLQEHENLDFLETQADFYIGNGFLLTSRKEKDKLMGLEFLGDTTLLPSILQSLNCTHGTIRTVGNSKPLGMYYPLTEDSLKPSYLGFIFD